MTDASTSEDYYYLHDHLHSPVAVVDIDGDVIERYEYDAYGKPTYWEGDYSGTIEATGIGNPYYFTGRRIDFVGVSAFMIQYNRGRFLDYYTGCWLNQDPIGYQDGPNLYAYVNSNPINRADLMGFLTEIEGGEGGRVIDPREGSREAICGELHPADYSAYLSCIEEGANPDPQGEYGEGNCACEGPFNIFWWLIREARKFYTSPKNFTDDADLYGQTNWYEWRDIESPVEGHNNEEDFNKYS